MKKKARVGMISLGCCKNQVDAERMLALLRDGGYEICADIAACDAVIVNTCGFIEDAKKEAIDSILGAAQYKKTGKLKALAVTGCLAERYRAAVAEQFPEADVVLGIGCNGEIVSALDRALAGERVTEYGCCTDLSMEGKRLLANDPYFAYVKIAEGCDNRCAYCAIPMIRGPYRSRSVEAIVQEVRELAAGGAVEIDLVAQDTSRYGMDLYGEARLPQLLDAVCEVEGVRWVRVLYCYPDRITDALLDTIARQPKVCKYLDIPVQHASARVLKAMNRRGDAESLLALVKKIRQKLPDAVLRTTLLAGFPGETEQDFEQLCLLVQEAKFERLGCFAYSQEEGTPAAALEQLPEEVRRRRAEIVMELQASVAFDFATSRVGMTLPVLVEGTDETYGYVGRSAMDAPDVDPHVYFSSLTERLPGQIIDVVITDSVQYDLVGCAVEKDAPSPEKKEPAKP